MAKEYQDQEFLKQQGNIGTCKFTEPKSLHEGGMEAAMATLNPGVIAGGTVTAYGFDRLKNKAFQTNPLKIAGIAGEVIGGGEAAAYIGSVINTAVNNCDTTMVRPDNVAQQKADQDAKAAQDTANAAQAAAMKATQDAQALRNAQAAAQDKAAQDKAAQDKAAQDKAAQDKAAQDKAAQDKAAQDKAAQDKAAQEKIVQEAEAKMTANNPQAAKALKDAKALAAQNKAA